MSERLKELEPFFCYICAGPATSRRLTKASSSVEINSYLDSDEDKHGDSADDSDEETDVTQEFYSDHGQQKPHTT